MTATSTKDNTVITKDLYNAKDIMEVRRQLEREQDYKDMLTGRNMLGLRVVLDHNHDDEQLVRGVLSHEVNAFIGKVENAYKRHIKYWLDMPLEELLDLSSKFIHKTKHYPDYRFRHNGWIKKIKTKFNNLNAKQKQEVLAKLGLSTGNNDLVRKKLFADCIKSKKYTFEQLRNIIKNTVKE